MFERRLLKNLDLALLFAAVAIVVYGCVMIYSAGRGASVYVQKQVIWACIGLAAGIVTASLDHSIYARVAGKLYTINILLLIAVLFAPKVKGVHRWITLGPISVQPAEFAKIILIICLAVFLVSRLDSIRSLRTFLSSFLYVAVPLALVFREPDLGTSLVIVAIWATMLFVLGTEIKNLLIFGGAVVLVGLAALNIPGVMKPYQKQRLATFLNPEADAREAGWHVTQARIAIGSGHIFGKGLRRGTQRELGFVPEPHTDFIFAVVGEELGFAGATALLALYFLLLWRALSITVAAEDPTGRAIAAGITGMFFFHCAVNLGMNLGLAPVTGVPLPMFSYGGSSLMVNLAAVGLLEGISMRRHKISF